MWLKTFPKGKVKFVSYLTKSSTEHSERESDSDYTGFYFYY